MAINDDLILKGKTHDLGGGMIVRRLLPQVARRMVGPFTFFDHMGPLVAGPAQNTDVRPHPHIGLSTLTYLFEGRITHRDSLGTVATILPGEVNWMTAGRGIAHSERTHEDDRGKVRRMHGLQFWIALPDEKEDCEPSFQHYEMADIPKVKTSTCLLALVAGEGWGFRSKVKTSSPLVLAHVEANPGDTDLRVEFPDYELACYVVAGSAEVDGKSVAANELLYLPPGKSYSISFRDRATMVIFGGEPFSSSRHIWWNLVSSSKEKIEAAKKKWKDRTFPMVPGETEFIPLPEN